MASHSLDGKSAIVTGASSGIGSETVRALARDGANVALAARREDRLEEIAADIEADHDVETLVVPTDVTDEGGSRNSSRRPSRRSGGSTCS